MNNLKKRSGQIFLIVFLLALKYLDTFAQEKKQLDPDTYSSFDLTLNTNLLANNGKWLAYNVVNKDSTGFIELKSIIADSKYRYKLNKTKFFYANTKPIRFSENSKWFAFLNIDTLHVIDLKSFKSRKFINVLEFVFPGKGDQIIFTTKALKTTSIDLMDLGTSSRISFNNLKEYKLSPDASIIAIINKEENGEILRCIALKPKIDSSALIKNKGVFTNLTWSASSKGLAFFEYVGQGKDTQIKSIHVYNNLDPQPSFTVLDPSIHPDFPVSSSISKDGFLLSGDGSMVFFNVRHSRDRLATVSDVKIWQPNDKKIPPVDLALSIPQLFVWQIEENRVNSVSDGQNSSSVLTGDQKNVLLYHTESYLPQFKYVAEYVDLYLKKISNGEKKLILKKINLNISRISASPKGKYIIYFLENNWWVYNIEESKHSCITSGLSVSFVNNNYDMAGEKPAYSNPIWTNNDKQVILYDQFDIWLIEPDGVKRERITNGRGTNETYRLHDYNKLSLSNALDYDSGEDILLTKLNNINLDQGLNWWNKRLGLKEILTRDKKIQPGDNLGSRTQPVLYIESDFDLAPRLILRIPNGKEQIIYQSSEHQKDFHWGKSKLINYRVDDKELKGALFYPANFDQNKKYPMIVHLYQTKSQYLHSYFPPNSSAEIGFNPTVYTANGYFVLYPDISYRLNEPGMSATRCIISAVEKVLVNGNVNKDRIGLMGYSFGGYESPFIISQTNIFRTAVSGAGAHDLVDFYLSVSPSGSNIWRFENQQWRIQAPFYSEEFQKNSTINHVQKINTPLLLFSGEEDTQVDWQQSRKLHIALWRLGKKSTLLLYPGDAHGLFSPSHTIDLNRRVRNWFDFYLKDEKPADWIVNGTK